MVGAIKPENPPATLSNAGPDELLEGKQEATDNSRTRPPLPNYGTWGDTVYPNCTHTIDQKAPKVTKSY